jgi:hypothetical protein
MCDVVVSPRTAAQAHRVCAHRCGGGLFGASRQGSCHGAGLRRGHGCGVEGRAERGEAIAAHSLEETVHVHPLREGLVVRGVGLGEAARQRQALHRLQGQRTARRLAATSLREAQCRHGVRAVRGREWARRARQGSYLPRSNLGVVLRCPWSVEGRSPCFKLTAVPSGAPG